MATRRVDHTKRLYPISDDTRQRLLQAALEVNGLLDVMQGLGKELPSVLENRKAIPEMLLKHAGNNEYSHAEMVALEKYRKLVKSVTRMEANDPVPKFQPQHKEKFRKLDELINLIVPGEIKDAAVTR